MKGTNNNVSMISTNENIRNLHQIYSTFLVKKNWSIFFGHFFSKRYYKWGGGHSKYNTFCVDHFCEQYFLAGVYIVFVSKKSSRFCTFITYSTFFLGLLDMNTITKVIPIPDGDNGGLSGVIRK